MTNTEKQLQPLTMNDSDFRGFLAKDCEMPEQIDCINQQAIETLRRNFLDAVVLNF